jgi:lysyl-tRNA synthetase class 2
VKPLKARHQVVCSLRNYLNGQGFYEVQAPLWVKGACPDAGTENLKIPDGYLITSTEYSIKRLMAEGFEQLYTLTQNFRPGDLSPRHNPEFTMLEWARSGASLEQIEQDAEAMIIGAWEALNKPELSWGGCRFNLKQPWEHKTVRQLVGEVCGEEPEDFSLQALNRASAAMAIPESFRQDTLALLSYLIGEAEHWLGSTAPVWVTEWPLLMTASAPPSSKEAAARSELFIAGLELADGFPFLRDSALQQQLFTEVLKKRQQEGRMVEPDWRFLACVEKLPEGAGMALGVDRLVMLLTGIATIQEVLPFAWEER